MVLKIENMHVADTKDRAIIRRRKMMLIFIVLFLNAEQNTWIWMRLFLRNENKVVLGHKLSEMGHDS